MSETPTKSAASPESVTPPRTINLASAATLAHAAGWVAAAIALKFSTSGYTDYLFKHATKSGKGHPHYSRNDPKDVATIAKDVTNAQKGYLLQAIILGLALMLLAVMLRRTRGATASRWSIVLVSVLTQAPLLLFTITGDLPKGMIVANFFIGLASLAAIVLLFLPASRAYFAEVRSVVSGGAPAGRGGGLFGGRARMAAGQQSARGGVLTSSAASRAQVKLSKASPQDKHRAEAAAVAKGAQIARNRAKAASKSRRMED